MQVAIPYSILGSSPGRISHLIIHPRAKETMKTLIAKFPGGYEQWAREKGEVPVERVMPPTTIGLELKERPI
jgi:hypothetical protein